MNTSQVQHTHEKNLKFRKVVTYIFGILEVLLAFRFIFKLLGANPGSPFVSAIYSLSELFLQPFIGIFRTGVAQGIETTAYLEAATLIAMAVYALLAYGIIRIVEIMKKPQA
ncbi:YggT family protein [Petrocella atlantisensis]|uniref:YggT family protein n=1 Tax=Petrocella atlantisensis TaxID=2173034 RepID=A0A3P7P0N7_9FIRM|nr:YggT family protein [Petrocella atlantisensis]VDN47030.1 YggT family protein [Petrocella atlantisensis]